MKVGDLVKFAGWAHIQFGQMDSRPKIAMIVALDGTGEYPQIEVMWPSGVLKKMRASLFEAFNESR